MKKKIFFEVFFPCLNSPNSKTKKISRSTFFSFLLSTGKSKKKAVMQPSPFITSIAKVEQATTPVPNDVVTQQDLFCTEEDDYLTCNLHCHETLEEDDGDNPTPPNLDDDDNDNNNCQSVPRGCVPKPERCRMAWIKHALKHMTTRVGGGGVGGRRKKQGVKRPTLNWRWVGGMRMRRSIGSQIVARAKIQKNMRIINH
jgi:hypothetical protein